MSILTNYFMLCSVAIGGKSLIINQITGPVHKIISNAELELYTKKMENQLVARETIVGAEDEEYSALVFE